MKTMTKTKAIMGIEPITATKSMLEMDPISYNSNEANADCNKANYYGRANNGAGAFQYRAQGNKANHSYDYGNNFHNTGGLDSDRGSYYGNSQSWMPTTPRMPLVISPYPWCWPCPPPPPPPGGLSS